jgi:hypothetical protein
MLIRSEYGVCSTPVPPVPHAPAVLLGLQRQMQQVLQGITPPHIPHLPATPTSSPVRHAVIKQVHHSIPVCCCSEFSAQEAWFGEVRDVDGHVPLVPLHLNSGQSSLRPRLWTAL